MPSQQIITRKETFEMMDSQRHVVVDSHLSFPEMIMEMIKDEEDWWRR